MARFRGISTVERCCLTAGLLLFFLASSLGYACLRRRHLPARQTKSLTCYRIALRKLPVGLSGIDLPGAAPHAITDVQKAHLRASLAIVLLHSGQVFVVAGGFL